MAGTAGRDGKRARSAPPDGDGALESRRPAWIVLPVADLARSLAFWHDTLRVPVRVRLDDRAELQTEHVGLVLRERSPDEAAPPVGARVGVAYEVADLAGALERLRGWGCEPGEPEDDPLLGRVVRLTDPDGHEVLVAEPCPPGERG